MSLPPSARERISLCMIVRNEERDLPRCLRSAQGWAGEIVVVDTGSQDGTAAVARSFGARVLPFPWCDDFSAARNASLDAATRSWALVLDADDELVVADADEMAAAVQQEALAGYQLLYRNVLDGGQTSRCDVFRLFRRDLPGMRYRGLVHEQVAAVADLQVRTGRLASAHINHYGYQAEQVQRHDKRARNMRLCLAQVQAQPDAPFAWFCLGMQQTAEDPGAAAASYRRALDLALSSVSAPGREPYVAHTYLGLVKVLLYLGEEQAAERYLEEGLGWFPASVDLRFLRAGRLLHRGDAAGAARDLEICVAPGGPPQGGAVLPTSDACAGYEGRTLLATAYLQLGRLAAAEAQLRQATAEAVPGYATAHRLLGALLAARGAWAEAASCLREAVARDPGDPALRESLERALSHLTA